MFIYEVATAIESVAKNSLDDHGLSNVYKVCQGIASELDCCRYGPLYSSWT
jgi:hypothetical protein